MIVKTLREFIRAVEYEASIRGQVGSGNTFRHPEVDVIAECNSAYGEFREFLVTRDFDFFIEETAQTSVPTSRADTDENYSLIDWPAAAQLIKRVDYLRDKDWTSLESLDWTQLRLPISGRIDSNQCRRIEFFSAKSFGTVTGATESVGKIALAPFVSTGKIKLSYLPRWVDVSDDTFKFIFPSETGFRWCVWNVVARICVRDSDSAKRYDKSLAERQICEDRIGKYSARTIATGSGQMRRSRTYNG